ncbi:MAG: glycosyltransferase family 4 protein [Ignavibacteria bacterium]
MKERIIILQRLLPHYRIGFFRKFCERYVNTKILYGQPRKGESLKNAVEINDKNFILSKNLYFDKSGKVFLTNIYFKIFKYRPDIVISVFNVGNLNIYLLFILKFFLRYKLILWSFGYDPVRGFDPLNKFADKIRLYLSLKADAVIFYWETGRLKISKYSKKTDHYFVAPNTLDTENQFQLKEKFDKKGLDVIRKELGLKNKFHFVFVGRLLEDKQVDLLLKAFKILEDNNSDCSLSIVGDGPQRDNLTKLSKDLNLRNVRFLGEILDEEKTGELIYVSDAFVMPGRLGLSVVHSFCFGTPVISQLKTGDFHGEGVGYIKENLNGYLVEDGSVKAIAGKMTDIISNPELSNKLRAKAFYTAQNECSTENMLKGFDEAMNYVKSK